MINNSQMANVQYACMYKKIIYGNNIVLNKSNTSAALLDYKYSIKSSDYKSLKKAVSNLVDHLRQPERINTTC